jgi:hypothetical protein
MEAASTSETSVDIYLTTQQYIPDDSELHYFMYLICNYERKQNIETIDSSYAKLLKIEKEAV